MKPRGATMPISAIDVCQCQLCQSGIDHGERLFHRQINLLMSRLDEQQRRWLAALEANRHGHGGIRRLSQITGLDEKTIQRGQQELELELNGRPANRVRLAGAGLSTSHNRSKADDGIA